MMWYDTERPKIYLSQFLKTVTHWTVAVPAEQIGPDKFAQNKRENRLVRIFQI